MLDENSRSFIREIFERHEQGRITPEELSQSIRILDAIYMSILRSHAALNDPSIDRMQLSLTYAALDRAALSQKAHAIGLENPPVDEAGINALSAAARSRDYELTNQITP